VDPDTGKTIAGKAGNELFHGITGVVWSEDHVTMTYSTDYNCSKKQLIVARLAAMVSLIPIGQVMELHTSSSWLNTEFGKLEGHVASEFSGYLSWVNVPQEWKKVLEYLMNQNEPRGLIIKFREDGIPSYEEVAREYLMEMIEKSKGRYPYVELDVAPWS
jgi:hypothetical protein